MCSAKCRRGKKKGEDGEGQIEVEEERGELKESMHMYDYADDMRRQEHT